MEDLCSNLGYVMLTFYFPGERDGRARGVNKSNQDATCISGNSPMNVIIIFSKLIERIILLL